MNSTEDFPNPDDFRSDKCYELYLYALSFAKQINEYIDNGFIVMDNNRLFKYKFVFQSASRKPCIALKIENSTLIWYGYSFSRDGKVWLSVIETKESIKKRFEQFKIIKPANVEPAF